MTGRELHDYPGNPLGVPSVKLFKENTKCTMNEKSAVKALLTNRGPLISLVDTSLKVWEKLIQSGSGEEKVKSLRQVIKVCAYWLRIKNAAAGNSALRNKRTIAVRKVLNSALAALNSFDPGEAAFATRKAQAIESGIVVPTVTTNALDKVKSINRMHNPNAKSLDAGYAQEREHYEVNGKQTKKMITPAGSLAHTNLPMFNNQIDWNNLGYDDFQTLIQGLDKYGYTSYLPKGERLQYLLLDAGANNLRRPNAIIDYDTARSDLPNARGDMWAMDRYGNLFVKDDRVIADVGHFNHSSFNAGNDVACAGMLVISHGTLVSIDNNSGHYKPDAAKLREALLILQAEYHVAVGLDGVRVGVVTNGGMQHFDGFSVMAQQSVVNWTAWNVANNVNLHLAPG